MAADLSSTELHERRERVFLILAGLFLGTLAMLNILGISRFISLFELQMGEGEGKWTLYFMVAVGVLPYPLTFLCTDLISEFYGRRRANWVVFVGLILNIWVVFILWLGGLLPGPSFAPVWGADGELLKDDAGRIPLFYEIRRMAMAGVFASMIAYLAAQLVDVQMFHFWKRLTKGRHLWLRNNGSTLVSQLVDTVAVILITYFTYNVIYPDSPNGLPINDEQSVLFQLTVSFILAGYVFKLLAALIDTPLIYLAVWLLKDYLQIDPINEHNADAEEVRI